MSSSSGRDDIGAFAAVINSRLAADARIANARAFGWLCAGLAIACCLIALGSAAALYGYSRMISVAPATELIASALSDAFNRASIKTSVSGSMKLASTEVVLARGQTVELAEGATVKLDNDSSVRVVGDLKTDLPQPSKRQLQLDTTSSSKELPFTRYTIFKSAGYGSGEVVTGWSFDLADPSRPTFQRCYYQQTLDKGVAATQTLAINGLSRRPSGLTKLSFDFDGAVANCIWFSGL